MHARALRFGPLGALLALVSLAAPARAEELKAEVKARLQNVEQSIDDWNIPAAKQELAELEKLLPGQLEPLSYYQGRIAFEEGRYPEAVKLLTAAGLSDKPGSYLRLAKDTEKVVGEHQRSESAHFVFFYPKGKDEVLVPYALDTLEAIRAALLEDLGYAPPGKVRVEIVNDAAELSKVSTLTREQIKTTGTIAICKFSKLMVTSPKAVVRGYDWLDTLAHEYVHLVVSQKSNNTVPIWLHEGLAKFLESRWRGKPGQAMSPSTLALLGSRVRKGSLIPFAKMHPSIALLPSAEDAATAFAEVFFAIDMLYRDLGAPGLQRIIGELAKGQDDKRAVELATGRSFAAFEKAWLAHVRRQPFPRDLIPFSTDEKKQLKGETASKEKDKKKGKEISFGDFAEVTELEARQFAHLGELMRERNRAGAAAEEYGRAHRVVGDKYESVSNKYALSLLELRRFDEAEKVLKGSLAVHPGAASTHVHLGRIYLRRKDYGAARASYLEALAADPFDEEIHLALYRAGEALGLKDQQARALKASALLTGLKPEQVPEVARTFARDSDNLADVALPPSVEGPGKPDAGPPPRPPTR